MPESAYISCVHCVSSPAKKKFTTFCFDKRRYHGDDPSKIPPRGTRRRADRYFAVCYSVLQCVAVCGSVWHCVAVLCCVLQIVTLSENYRPMALKGCW